MAKRWYAQPLMDQIHSSVWWLYWIVSWILLCSCCQAWFMNLDSFGNVAKMGWIESESQSAKMNLGESWIMVRVGSYMSGVFLNPLWNSVCLIVSLSTSFTNPSPHKQSRTLLWKLCNGSLVFWGPERGKGQLTRPRKTSKRTQWGQNSEWVARVQNKGHSWTHHPWYPLFGLIYESKFLGVICLIG